MKNSVIIYSGGMDSTVLLHERKKEIRLAISFNYGSKHNEMEFKYAQINTRMLGIEHIRIDLDFINKYFRSDLLKSGGEIPEGHYEDESMKRTIVPFRNGIMLSIAGGIAASQGFKIVLIANHSGDYAIYPDCRKDFISSFSESLMNGTDRAVSVVAPYTFLSKRQIALRGKNLQIDFNKTYTCYKGGEKHCGKCGCCVERREALMEFDTTEYL